MPAAKDPARCVLLLRAINVGKRQLPMAALREIAEALGFGAPKTHLASGNLIASVSGAPAAAAKRLEQSITEHFGFHSDVIVRDAARWQQYLRDNPFAEASASEPNRVMLLLANQAPVATAEALLRERAAPGETVRTVRDGLWIHFAHGIPASKLTPNFIDKCVGLPATGRNWRTVQALAGLLGTPE
ncbi:DUF1697 domain-containing protein [Aquincola sp. S2]|uniref:DUF1697 domain-containing protein n=1 Tax=Pseudaquabacterium terrae TaxID=2732868 RepID=A0ABX2EEG9_9BURK|nr:DUF1697 domain-containing protein [Aquabacterium terrae]NRF66998.1 DUF1697 domain-containing protein [Aquabacterium terrae]